MQPFKHEPKQQEKKKENFIGKHMTQKTLQSSSELSPLRGIPLSV